MLKLSNRDFTIAIINILKDITEKVNKILNTWGTLKQG